MKKILRIWSIILWIVGWIIAIIAIAGVYKFNILQDDIFFSWSGMTQKDQELFVWSRTQPIPWNKKEKQGFILNEDWTAMSINMITLVYKKRKINDWKLILIAESIWNGTSSISDIEYEIESIGKKLLYLNINWITSMFEKSPPSN